MRRNIRYKKACSHYQDQVKWQHQKGSNIINTLLILKQMLKFISCNTVTFSGCILQFLSNGNGIILKTKQIQHIQAQSSQASHLRPRSDFSETILFFGLISSPPKKKTYTDL